MPREKAGKLVRAPGRTLLLSLLAVLAALFAAGVPSGRAMAAPRGAQGCQELVVNGGFENGHDGWVEYSSESYELIDPFYPHTGAKSAWLAVNNNEEDWISQTVQLPMNAGSLNLAYWWSVYTEENPGGAFDYLRVQLLRVDGTLLATLATYNNESAEAWLWNPASVDMSAYAGQTLQLRFQAKNDANNPTSFFVDDVSIQACPTGATPTPTPTTGTPTPSPTPTFTSTPGPSPTPTATPRFKLYLPVIVR